MALEHPLVEQVRLLVPITSAPASLSDEQLLDAVERLGAVRRAVDTLGAELAAEVARRCHEGALAARHGEKSAAALVSTLAGVDADEARDWCLAGTSTAPRSSILGEELEPYRPELARALASGAASGSAIAKSADALN